MNVILISQKEEFDEEHLHRIEKYAPVTWIDAEKTDLNSITELFDTEEKILALSPVPIDWTFPIDLYEKLRHVTYLCLVTTSYEFLDMDACDKYSLRVTNVPHYSTESVAEQLLMMILSISKKIPAQIKNNFTYEFTTNVLGDDVKGKTVGILGLGDIGMRLAVITSALGMNVTYWSRHKKDVPYQFKELSQIISESDIIVPTVVANKDTFGMLTKDLLEHMKKSAYFVSLIDERIWDKHYLLDRANKGTLAGLGFESQKERMVDHKGNVFILPPLAWYSKQSLKQNIEIWTDTIISCIQGKPTNLVDRH